MAEKTVRDLTKPFRLAFPFVFEKQPPKKGSGREGKFCITMLFPKSGDELVPNRRGMTLLEIRKFAYDALKDKFSADKTKWPKALREIDPKTHLGNGDDGWPIRDGDEVDWEGFAGHVFIRAASNFQPGVIDAKKRDILEKDAVFGGLICQAQIHAYGYDNESKGVNIGLDNLMVLKDDGVAFSGRQRAADVFDDFSDGAASPASAAASDGDAW